MLTCAPFWSKFMYFDADRLQEKICDRPILQPYDQKVPSKPKDVKLSCCTCMPETYFAILSFYLYFLALSSSSDPSPSPVRPRLVHAVLQDLDAMV